MLIWASKSSNILCLAKSSIASKTQNGELEIIKSCKLSVSTYYRDVYRWRIFQREESALFVPYSQRNEKDIHKIHLSLYLYYNSILYHLLLDILYCIVLKIDKFDFWLFDLWTKLNDITFQLSNGKIVNSFDVQITQNSLGVVEEAGLKEFL